MNEAIPAQIHPYVRKLEAAGVKKYEIARLKLRSINRFADFRLLARRPRQGDTGGLLKHIANEAAAIETLLGRVAAKLVVDTN